MEKKLSNRCSSSSSPPAKKYDIFLSFRGEDTRNNFTGHLSLALRKIGLFNIFKDDYALHKGKEIGPELLNAIDDSHYAVVILSENYADSHWCLKELAKIVECMGDSGRIRTIFYHVDPSDVRNQKGSFGKAMAKHEKDSRHRCEDVQSWRNALTKVANQSGEPIKKDEKDEAIFIDNFVKKLSKECGASIRIIEGLFGMTSRLKKLDSYVLQSSAINNVCFIGIHGMGGIGKSTLAEAYYKKMSHKFEGCCFLPKLREVSKMENGLVELQKQLLSNILGEDLSVGHVDEGRDKIRSRLRAKKVLIVLDDLDDLEQLNALADSHRKKIGSDNECYLDIWFGSGSVIIVTTRNESLLRKRFIIFEAEQLDDNEALQLFSWKAFESIEPQEEYRELSKQVVKHANNLPLALKLFGSQFGQKRGTNEWESALRKLKKFPAKEIIEKLKISFNELDKLEQSIFLDIACFFKGFEESKVKPILNCCGFEPDCGIPNLVCMSLLRIIEDGRKLWMHDKLQEMGQQICRGNEADQRPSRVWDKDVLENILQENIGTENVEAIVVTFEEGSTSSLSSFDALSNMKKLRLLMILGCFDLLKSGCSTPRLDYLSNNLRLLEWNRFPFREFPPTFRPEKLVKLKLTESNLERLFWNKPIKLPHLKVIDLTDSESFKTFGYFSAVPNLERLILSDCLQLSEIHSETDQERSITILGKLTELNLKNCRRLKKFPPSINGLNSLKILNLSGCSKLRNLPLDIGVLNNLRKLDVKGSGIRYLPSSLYGIKSIEIVRDLPSSKPPPSAPAVLGYSSLPSLAGSLSSLVTFFWSKHLLTTLDLSNRNISDGAFPDYFGRLVSLENLVLSKNPFTVLPPSISRLSKLKFLVLEYCKDLISLGPELPSSLEEVNVNYCSSLKSFLDPLKPSNLLCSAVCVDCFELVKTQDSILTAFTSLQRHLQDPCNLKRKFGIVLVGSKIPAWFTKPYSRSTISLKLGKCWCSNKWKGFALAVCFWADSPDDFCCDVKLEMGDGNLEIATVDCPTSSGSSNHLWVSYVHREQLNVAWENCTGNIEFSFRSKTSVDKNWHCGPWSVRLVYKKDIKMLPKITTKNEDHVRPLPSYEEMLEKLLTAARRPMFPRDSALIPKMECSTTSWQFKKRTNTWGAAAGDLGNPQDEALISCTEKYTTERRPRNSNLALPRLPRG